MSLDVYAGLAYGYSVDAFALAIAARAWPIFKPAARTLDVIAARARSGKLVVRKRPRAHVGSLPTEVFEIVRDMLWWQSCKAGRQKIPTMKMLSRCECDDIGVPKEETPCWSKSYTDVLVWQPRWLCEGPRERLADFIECDKVCSNACYR